MPRLNDVKIKLPVMTRGESAGDNPYILPVKERRVYARLSNGIEVVKYPRGIEGKWYVELGQRKQRVTFNKAVEVAISDPRAWIFFNQPGGKNFDRLIKEGREKRKLVDSRIS